MSIYTHSATQFDPVMVEHASNGACSDVEQAVAELGTLMAGGDVPVVLPDESLVDNTVTETPPADETEPTI